MKPAKSELRTQEQNDLYQAMAWDILKHLAENEVPLRENGPLWRVIEPHHEFLKLLLKTRLGIMVEATIAAAPLSTTFYTKQEMAVFILAISAWASVDLNLVLEI